MLRTPGQRAFGIAVLAATLLVLLVGHELWTPPLTRSSTVVTYADHVLVDVLGIGESKTRPDSTWTQWYLYGISTVGAVLLLVRFLLHWRFDREELALVPVARSTVGPAEFRSHANATASTEDRREPPSDSPPTETAPRSTDHSNDA